MNAAPRPRRRKEARPAELADAALSLFAEKGYAATRLDDVAARAGVAKGTVYLYYASKEALFDGVIRNAVLPVLDRGEQRVERHIGAAADLLRESLADWLELMTATPLGQIPKLLVADGDKFPELARTFHDGVVRRARDLIGRIVRLGIRRGEFRRVDVGMTVECLLSAVLMSAIGRSSTGFRYDAFPSPRRYAQSLTALLVMTDAPGRR